MRMSNEILLEYRLLEISLIISKISKIRLYHTERQFSILSLVCGDFLYIHYLMYKKDEKTFNRFFSLHVDK